MRAQNAGFIRLADKFAAGRGAIGLPVEKDELLATIADEATARQLKQARGDLDSRRATRANFRCLPRSRSRSRKINVQRLERLSSLSNVPAVDYEKAKSEVTRLRGAGRIGTDRARSQYRGAR